MILIAWTVIKLDKTFEQCIQIADGCVSLGKGKEVKKIIAQAQKKAPKIGLAWNKMGLILSNAKMEKDAVKCFKKCLELDPENLPALCNLAGYYGSKGKKKDFDKLSRRILEIDPTGEKLKKLMGQKYA